MQPNPPPSHLPKFPEMPSTDVPQMFADNPTSSSLFDWSDFLDFNIDETFNVSVHHPEPERHDLPEPEQQDLPGLDESQPSENSSRVRKRDPMLVCPNFLAGQIPCACPELDEKLAEEDSALPGKKRTMAVRVPGGNPLRCQVPGCEVDISELKGYHKRHRVCLRCANASVVVLDGESKRYCQQCGKFHILSDFDKGKRSCRRKLERHNNRRRRKPNDAKGGMEKESQQTITPDDISGDDDAGKDVTCVSSQIGERETFLESDRHGPTPSALGSQNVQSDSVVSFTTSGEIHIDGEKQSPEFKRSPSYSENKSNFSSVCPTGRISFKLYDWNPAEFPRRLRHQIFQWLASMPVELEGYIRPGCTILTAFIAMPKPMWIKLFEEPTLRIKGLVGSPGSMLFGRGTMLVYINDMIFRVTKDATSVAKIEVKGQSPKLHYIYPTFFEAGKPMEFVACGSDLLQPRFRFLLSVAGRYLAYKISVSSPCCTKRDAISCNHQLLNIYVPQTDMHLCGPMFVEVENQSGLSNFIPILVGDKETCAEMEILQQKFESGIFPEERQVSECEAFFSRQEQFSEFVLDVAWSLKKPEPNQQFTFFHIQRLNYLVTSLIEMESSVILERVFCSLKSAVDNNLVDDVPDAEMKLLRKNMDIAQTIVNKKLWEKDLPVIDASNASFYSQSSQNDNHSVVPNKDIQRTVKNTPGIGKLFQFVDEAATVPLLNVEVAVDVDNHPRPGKSCSRLLLTRTFLTTRPLIMAVMVVGICFGVCAMVLHPQRVSHIATTIQTCLFNNS